ncbi:hypothetical protein SCB71_13610 [Herbiconiux sp. KACC 21604]|uniref:hypothetical protein n=1 Tax=unclassified Herbiconiux TaxID=2618217 RepID=UPI0014909D7E|nr:hypothetical protein [Herbiconiux sp. SALV-R1]QJU54195.1 hypothetical protein HL652_11560 [Herbiconiux sp. SALV-R1]WPO85249.1 hypothetical protein SCB71_13610 [Herbiconiux sp. KACC 21604]
MSSSEPFLPAGQPAPEPDPRDHDLDGEADTELADAAHAGEPDADADAAAVHEREHAEHTAFRRPTPGDRLTAEQLEQELDAE